MPRVQPEKEPPSPKKPFLPFFFNKEGNQEDNGKTGSSLVAQWVKDLALSLVWLGVLL